MNNKSILACTLCLIILAVCNACTNSGQPSSSTQQASPAPSAAVATATPFVALPQGTQILNTQTFKSPNQTSYTIQTVEDDQEEALRSQPSGTREVAPMAAPVSGDQYVGTARKAAKLLKAVRAAFNLVNELLLFAGRPESSMVKYNAGEIPGARPRIKWKSLSSSRLAA